MWKEMLYPVIISSKKQSWYEFNHVNMKCVCSPLLHRHAAQSTVDWLGEYYKKQTNKKTTLNHNYGKSNIVCMYFTSWQQSYSKCFTLYMIKVLKLWSFNYFFALKVAIRADWKIKMKNKDKQLRVGFYLCTVKLKIIHTLKEVCFFYLLIIPACFF